MINHGQKNLLPSLTPEQKSDTLFWRLVLKDVTVEDSGLYQCQVEGLTKVNYTVGGIKRQHFDPYGAQYQDPLLP